MKKPPACEAGGEIAETLKQQPAISTSPPAQDQALAEHAAAIRALGKQTAQNVIEIGRRLTDAKQIIGHGGWLPWLDREFKWSDRTALNFIRVYEMAAKSETVSDLKLPMRALYLLAAPSTPEPARAEVIERTEAGEELPATEVKRVVEKHKGRKQQ